MALEIALDELLRTKYRPVREITHPATQRFVTRNASTRIQNFTSPLRIDRSSSLGRVPSVAFSEYDHTVLLYRPSPITARAHQTGDSSPRDLRPAHRFTVPAIPILHRIRDDARTHRIQVDVGGDRHQSKRIVLH